MFVMPHGMLDPYFQRAPDRKLKAIRNWLYWKLIEEKVVHTADGVLFTCEAELLLAREPFRPYHPKAEINVGYGIQPPPAYTHQMAAAFQAKCPQVDGHPYLLFLSRIHEKKGVDLLIHAYAKISGRHAPKLVIAGPGIETGYGKQVLELVSSLGLRDSVVFPGMLNGPSKWGAFYHCEAFVLPSHQENFGIAVVEALACAKPVLITRQINIWKEIDGAGAGLVSDDDLKGTIDLLTRWQELSPEEKLQMSANARKAYESNFEIESTARRFVKAMADN
jgi:glycosyltransferase involved in cell wall biosynthesis